MPHLPDNAFLEALMAESMPRPGEHRAADAHVLWGERAVVLTRLDEPPVVLESGDITSIQLSRSSREPPRGLLSPRRRDPIHLLHAELRGKAGHRLRFQARVAEPTLLDGLPTLETRGTELPLEALQDLVATATSLGATFAGWSPSDTTLAARRHDDDLAYLASLHPLWPEDAVAEVAPDDPDADFNSLLAAVELSEDWTTLRVAPGLYRVSRPLVIERPLRIIGAGHTRTRILCEAAGYVVRVTTGCALFAATDVAFEHSGGVTADVCLVEGAPVDFLRCLFAGGQRGEEDDQGGHGVVLLEGSRGGLRGCESVRNRGDGFSVEHGDHSLVLDGNGAQANIGHGICVRGASGGLFRDNSCLRNGGHGVLVTDNAFPRIERNTCDDNAVSGIHVQEHALGVIEDNSCARNGEHGVSAGGAARPIVRGNRCSHNASTGITLVGLTEALLQSNPCSDNALYGVYVGGEARPQIEDTVCERNGHAGFAFRDLSAPRVRYCVARHNAEHGFYAGEQSAPGILASEAHDNEGCGVLFRDRAAGSVRHSTCTDNARDGIHACDDTGPELIGNTCVGNGQDGLSLRDASAAVLRQNRAQLNLQDGIFVGKHALGVRLEDNTSEANGGEDIRDERGG